MQGPLALGLLALLLAAANGQYPCSVYKSQANCSVSVQSCSKGVCIFTLQTVFSGKDNVNVTAYVENSTTCRTNSSSLSLGADTQVKTSSMCFQGFDSNQSIIMAVPPKSSVRNGLRCAGCSELNADQCKNKVNVPCMDSEDRCINFAGTLAVNGNATLVVEGCATQSVCGLKVNDSFHFSQQTYTLTRVSCIPATNTGSPAAVPGLAFFPTLAGLLLVKQLS